MTNLIARFNSAILKADKVHTCLIREASKKTGTSTRNQKNHARPKHRGWHVQDGALVQAGTLLVTQRTLRFHPGLNVGFGRNGTLFAIKPGKVLVTCEKPNMNWEHSWVQRNYGGRMYQQFYKKYFNIICEKQHQNFNLIEQI